MRHVADVDGSEWEVFAVERMVIRREAVRDALADGWLCFQRTDGHRVRVPNSSVPLNWEKLSSPELLALRTLGLPAKPRQQS